ncbi:hypothetical protein N7486_007312 [Penicillium sp. IBT 16267x]|nr:hypothetical protein N7486_007312 [Penicillium sp. IBT 16267x]
MLGWSEEMMSAFQYLMPDHKTPTPSKESAILAINFFFTYVNSIIPLYDQERFMGLFNQQYSENPPTSVSWYATFNAVLGLIPLYDQERFMGLFNQQYSENPPTSVSWYATFNAVLGLGELVYEDEIGLQSSEMDTPGEASGPIHALSCLQNCYSVFTQLAYSCRELLSVQALIGMSLILDMLLDAEASYMAIGAAGRLALGLGLHRTLVDSHLTLGEVEERRNVFWVLYVLDRGVSLRLGRPPTICDEDIEVSEPTLGPISQPSQIKDGFAQFVKLNRIKSEIYSKLYSVRSMIGECQAERLASLQSLEEKLIIWQKSLPTDMQSLPQVVHYPNAVRKKCLTAARHTAELLDKLHQSGNMFRSNFSRYISYYPLSAFFDIFINLLENPLDSSTSADLHLLHIVMDSMLNALTTSSSPFALLLAEGFQKMTDMAHNVLIRTKSEGSNSKTLPHVVADTNATRSSVNATGGLPPPASTIGEHHLISPMYHTSLPPDDTTPYLDETGTLGLDIGTGTIAPHLGSADDSLNWTRHLQWQSGAPEH